VLYYQNKVDEAITEFRAITRLAADHPLANYMLGVACTRKGLYGEALAAFRRSHESGPRNPSWRLPSAQWIQRTERMVELEKKLPSVVSGAVKPADASETFTLAVMCIAKELYGVATRFCIDAFKAQPALAEDLAAQNRYFAACAGALAGPGRGKDSPPPDEKTRTICRKQALDWLKADVAARSRLLDNGPPQVRNAVANTLLHWKRDPDLTGIRDEAALSKLPADEQQACRALWAAVDELLKRARGAASP
jgi:hypothetical protein